MPGKFDYNDAFSRNIGWLTDDEQQMLRGKRVAIAGMGGVGGVHLLTLARLGVGRFNIADFDKFEIANMNRQIGAVVSSLDRPKTDVMAEMALDINPDIELLCFNQGVTADNIDEFLNQVDFFIDGLDFYVLEFRRKLFARCRELNIPALTAAPVGMGTAYLNFLPNHMSFEDYFCMEGLSAMQQQINFLLGLAPRGLHMAALRDESKFNIKNKTAPSVFMGCELSAAVAGIESLKVMLGRGKVYPAPYFHQFDGYSGRWVRGWMPGGNRNPIQWLKLQFAYRKFIK